VKDSRMGYVGAPIAGSSVTKTDTLLEVSAATVSKVMSACEDSISEEKVAKDCITKSQSYCNKGDNRYASVASYS
jgi:hypothetical protein